MHIHPVFHVSLLEPHVANTFPGRVLEVPLPIRLDGLPEFEVNSNLDSRFRRIKLQYLVDWVGYDASDRSSEPPENLDHAEDAIAHFYQMFPSRPRPSGPVRSNI